MVVAVVIGVAGFGKIGDPEELDFTPAANASAEEKGGEKENTPRKWLEEGDRRWQ